MTIYLDALAKLKTAVDNHLMLVAEHEIESPAWWVSVLATKGEVDNAKAKVDELFSRGGIAET
jgi:hypothetical protein